MEPIAKHTQSAVISPRTRATKGSFCTPCQYAPSFGNANHGLPRLSALNMKSI